MFIATYHREPFAAFASSVAAAAGCARHRRGLDGRGIAGSLRLVRSLRQRLHKAMREGPQGLARRSPDTFCFATCSGGYTAEP
ncbi:hypothetical protein PFLCHA0_c33720 [Pseudomonas protegens CHA0]|uniref:Uncharacterized protein n=1 Tax=Pseudomonas protegens (strain DSM 19095 / LMG 27888 / CFBP 6595 / CHA0) TaxID=1124983 RepID=A0A2C9EN94_PSEPH|nr:hypothetical protein PFLCHA0_c33720 [Pseudomonas protegens CHA0]